MSEASPNESFDLELEARIVAMVLGEASDFERDQLQQMIAKRSELVTQKARFEAIDKMLRDVGNGEPVAGDASWKLPSKNRDRLISIMNGQTPALMEDANNRSSTKIESVRNSFGLHTRLVWIVAIAGCLCLMVASPFLLQDSTMRTSQVPASFDLSVSGELQGENEWGTIDALAPPQEQNGLSDVLPTMPQEGRWFDLPVDNFDFGLAGDVDAVKDGGDTLDVREGIIAAVPAPASPYFLGDDVQYLPVTPRIVIPDEETPLAGIEIDSNEVKAKQLDDQLARPQIAGDFAATAPQSSPISGGANLYFQRQQLGRSRQLSETELPLQKGFEEIDTESLARERQPGNVNRGLMQYGEKRIAGKEISSRDLSSFSINGQIQKHEGVEDQFGEVRLEFDGEINLGQKLRVLNRDKVKKRKSQRMAPAKQPATMSSVPEVNAEVNAFSTFSLHVSDVSFKLARSALAQGEWPENTKIRIEEFVNAFDYGDPIPNRDERVACRVEQCIHPFLQQRNLLRVSMRTAAVGRASETPLRLTLLLDGSGSMERIDRQQTVRRAFALLAAQLKPIDQVTLIRFARQPRLIADRVSGGEANKLVELIRNLPSEGGTNIESALQLAFEKAKEQQDNNAQNRIILLTDGAVNLGNANPDRLLQMVVMMRDAGISFDAAGISAEGLNDEILEALTRKGDGRYYLLDSMEDANDGFAEQIAGALRPFAKNVKVQVAFNPKRVGNYKLLGFEKHLLKKEDFRNDQVDAAEMAASEAGVAVYQVEAKPEGEGDIGSVSVRFSDLSTGQMVENRWPIPYETDTLRIEQASSSIRLAAVAAMFAEKLKGEVSGELVDLKTLFGLVAGLPESVRHSDRVEQLRQMIEQARGIVGE